MKVPLILRRRNRWLDTWVPVRMWDGEAPAPEPIKQLIVKGYARTHGVRTLVETGTYLGDMIAATRSWFKEVHTIELDPTMADRARRRFRRHRHIHVHQGDSSELLSSVLDQLTSDALFWLDAHYSGGFTAQGATETPIEQELTLVLPHPRAKVVLVDDARIFGSRSYPSLEKVAEIADSYGWVYAVDMDIIRLTKPTH